MRSYPVPKRVQNDVIVHGPLTAAAAAGTLTTDQLEMIVATQPGSSLGAWATKTLEREAMSQLTAAGFGNIVPMGVLSSNHPDDEVVVALASADGRTFTTSGWQDGVDAELELVELDVGTAAFVASALKENTVAVLRAWWPVATIAAATAPAKPATDLAASVQELPPGAVAVAVVDELDKSAVLELVAVAPGPVLLRRHAGGWYEDAGWLARLRSVRPPHLVELTPEQVASVTTQVDEATADDPFEEAEALQSSGSPWADKFTEAADTLALQLFMTRAAAGQEALIATAKGAAGAERLRQYWMNGEGAVKIRWGTPGDWKRCVRQLSKHLGVRAKGYCNLAHARKTGQWSGSKKHGVKDPRVVAEAIAKQHVR